MMYLKEFKRHAKNIKIFRAYSGLEFAKQAVLFPFDYYFKKGKASYPLNIALFVTLRCNARCGICKLRDTLNKRGEKEPTPEDIDRFLSSIRGTKPSIILYGGEPFIRKDMVEITRVVKKRGFRCGIFTNGILLDQKIINGLVDAKLDFIVFSIQGKGRAHDETVGVKGAFDKLLENMDLFIKQKKHTKVIAQIMITEENTEDLRDLARIASSKGADLIRFGHPTFFTPSDVAKNKKVCEQFFPKNDISEMSYAYDPDENINKYYDSIKALKEEFGGKITFLPDLELNEVKNWYSSDFKTNRKCLFLWRGIFIYPNGDAYPCESLAYPIGNIYREKFSEIWNNDRYVALRKLIKKGLLPACARCCKL